MKELYTFAKSKAGKALLIISGALTAVICLVMNIVLIPQIESTTNGIRCFDMNFGYSFDTAKEFLSLLGEEGRQLYLGVQLPLDFVYPIAYCVFFSLLIVLLTKKTSVLLLFPVTLAAFDYAENICSIVMLRSGELSRTTALVGSACTSLKTILMYAVFLIIIICLIAYFINKKKKD